MRIICVKKYFIWKRWRDREITDKKAQASGCRKHITAIRTEDKRSHRTKRLMQFSKTSVYTYALLWEFIGYSEKFILEIFADFLKNCVLFHMIKFLSGSWKCYCQIMDTCWHSCLMIPGLTYSDDSKEQYEFDRCVSHLSCLTHGAQYHLSIIKVDLTQR